MGITGANIGISNISEAHRLHVKQRLEQRAALEAKREPFSMDKNLETCSVASSLNSLIVAGHQSQVYINTRETTHDVKFIIVSLRRDLEYIIAEHLDYGYILQGTITTETNGSYSATMIKKNSKRL